MAKQEKVFLTHKGYEELLAEKKQLVEVEIPATDEAVKVAKSYGDLSENADYTANKHKLVELNKRLEEILYMINNVEFIEDATGESNIVKNGYYVYLKVNKDGKLSDAHYMIVGSTETDPLAHKISNESPLAAAILGKAVGETVQIKAIRPYEVTILKVTAEEIK
jgi:transcription elongation factor GreA